MAEQGIYVSVRAYPIDQGADRTRGPDRVLHHPGHASFLPRARHRRKHCRGPAASRPHGQDAAARYRSAGLMGRATDGPSIPAGLIAEIRATTAPERYHQTRRRRKTAPNAPRRPTVRSPGTARTATTPANPLTVPGVRIPTDKLFDNNGLAGGGRGIRTLDTAQHRIPV